MRYVLEQVVSEGSGKKAKLEGYRIGGKTATSEKLPRSLKKYISSFIGFAPADNPQVMALITIEALLPPQSVCLLCDGLLRTLQPYKRPFYP